MKTGIKLPAVLLSLLLLGSHAAAQVVGFNFMEDYNSTDVNFGLGAASDDAGHTFWNRVGQSNGAHPQDRATMFTSDGTTATDVRFSFSNDSYGTGGSHDFSDALFRGYYYSWGAFAPFTISGLTAGQTYDFYFYSETGTAGQDWAADFTLDGNVQHLTAVQTTSFVQGDNYVMFTLTPTGTSLSGGFQVTGSSGVAVLSGAQVAVSTSAIPEPSTYATICGALALVGVVIHRRRESAKHAA